MDLSEYFHKARLELYQKVEEQFGWIPEETLQSWKEQGYYLDIQEEFKDNKIILTAEMKKL